MTRRYHATVAGIALTLGVICLGWGRLQAPGAWLVRGYAGDVVIVIFLVAVLGLVTALRVGNRATHWQPHRCWIGAGWQSRIFPLVAPATRAHRRRPRHYI